jgi:hypothetical protein
MNERRHASASQARQETLEDAQEDARVAQALAPLTTLEPTAELRLKNRRRLATALVARERERLRPRLAFWRRRVTLPLALILLIVLASLLLGAFLGWLIGDANGSLRLQPLSSVSAPMPSVQRPAHEAIRLSGIV